jgi:glycogen synthase
LRVLHLIYDDPANPWVGGGGAVRVRELYRRLGDRVDAVVASGAYPGARDGVIEGVRYRRLGQPSPYAWSRLSFARDATRILQRDLYDAAVVDFSAYTPILVPRRRPVGITVHHVTSPTAAQRWGRSAGAAITAVERMLLRRGRVFSATSRATESVLRRILPPGADLVPVGAGVDDRLFEVARREEDYLLYFGRLDWFQKGLDVLLEAVVTLAGRFPALELRIAGRGRDAERVRTAARDLGLDSRVTMLGPVSDEERLALFAGARLMLMPSRFEGFGMVAAEAMAAGVPIVAAASGSLPEVVAPPDGGVLVPADDASALARAAAMLLEDDAARALLSASARRSAERFRWDAVAEQHLTFLRRIAASC